MTMLKDDDSTTRNDVSEINLVEDEWVAIKQLVKILEPFASGTELLKGSNYTTISFMHDVLTEITNGIISLVEIEPEEIDLTNRTTIFDNYIGIEDPGDDDEVDDHPKRRKISINVPQDCNNLIKKIKSALCLLMNHYWDVPQDEAMIATFLDPRCKSLNFASDSQIDRTKNLLRKIFEEEKQKLGTSSPGNPLLHTIFANRYQPERRNELMNMWFLMKLDLIPVLLNVGFSLQFNDFNANDRCHVIRVNETNHGYRVLELGPEGHRLLGRDETRLQMKKMWLLGMGRNRTSE